MRREKRREKERTVYGRTRRAEGWRTPPCGKWRKKRMRMRGEDGGESGVAGDRVAEVIISTGHLS